MLLFVVFARLIYFSLTFDEIVVTVLVEVNNWSFEVLFHENNPVIYFFCEVDVFSDALIFDSVRFSRITT